MQALDTIEVAWNDRIYTPLVTLWVFLGQVLSADHSCRNAVARLIVHRVSQGLSACSSRTGAYCQARKRLPEQFFSTIARIGRQKAGRPSQRGMALERTPRLHVRRHDNVDARYGSQSASVSTDLESESAVPVFRWLASAAIFSLSCGVILIWRSQNTQAKVKAKSRCFTNCRSCFHQGDVLLADALMCNWRVLYSFKQRGVDVVTRLNKAHRKADFRRGKRLGKDDHLVDWPKPFIREYRP